jgi:predicted nuclease of predicted toxin-antitoxin system
MARLYSNENFPLPSVQELRRLGHDVLTSYEAGNAEKTIPDEDVLAFSIAEKRCLMTFNRKHFIHLHNLNAEHNGVIVCTFDSNFVALAERIHSAILTENNLAGKLIRINRLLG